MQNALQTVDRGRSLYEAGQPFAECATAEDRRGWILAQNEATLARTAASKARIRAGGKNGGTNARGVKRKAYDRAPDWWLDEMKDAMED